MDRPSNQKTKIIMTTLNKTGICGVCGGKETPTTTTYHVRRHGVVYVFENVPAYVCEKCNEESFDIEVLQQINETIDAGQAPAAPVVNFESLEYA